MYTTKIKKWGNSLALRIPKHLADSLQLDSDVPVDLEIVEGTLRVVPHQRPQYSLDDLLDGVTQDNVHAEQSFGESTGNEVW